MYICELQHNSLPIDSDWSQIKALVPGRMATLNTGVRTFQLVNISMSSWLVCQNDIHSYVVKGSLGDALETIKPQLWASERGISIEEIGMSHIQERVAKLTNGAALERTGGMLITQSEEGEGIPFYTCLIPQLGITKVAFDMRWCIRLTKADAESWLTEQRAKKWQHWQDAVAKGETVWMSTRKGTAGDNFPSGTLISREQTAHAILPDGRKMVVKTAGWGASQESWFEADDMVNFEKIDILKYRILEKKQK